MSNRQFSEWRAYYDIEPFGEEREDWRNAHIVQTLLSVFRGKGKKAPAIKDCRLTFGSQAPKAKTVEQQRAEIMHTMDILMIVQNAPEQQRKRARKA